MAQEIYQTLSTSDGHAHGDGVNNPSSSTLTDFEVMIMTTLQTNVWTSETSPLLEINDDAFSAMGSTDINISNTSKEYKYNSAAAMNQKETSTSNTMNQNDHNSDENCWHGSPPQDNPFNIEIKIVASTTIYSSGNISAAIAKSDLLLEPHFLYPFNKKQTSQNLNAFGMHNHNL